MRKFIYLFICLFIWLQQGVLAQQDTSNRKNDSTHNLALDDQLLKPAEIMSPHYKALRDGNATTIPLDYLPKDYIAPSFNTKQTKD